MSHELNRLAARLFNAPLLVLPDVAETIAENLGARFAGFEAAFPRPANLASPEADADPYAVDNGVATIPVRGELVNRGSFMNSLSGMTSYDSLQSALRQAAADPRVMSVILDMDSPGGEAAGAMETADEVRALSRIKPVTAYVNSLAASAGYAIASGAKEIVVPPSGTVGSIGVVWMHLDRSQAMKDRGVKPTLLTAGAFKADGHGFGPLDPEARERIQSSINDTYSLFVETVGKYRPQLGADGARGTEAALFMGQKAVDAGLADRVSTLSQLLKSRSASSAIFSGFSLMTESTAHSGAVVVAPSLSTAPDPTHPDNQEAAMAEALAVEAARKDTTTDVKARIKTILSSPGAKAFPTLAASLAYDSDIAAELANAQLAAALADRPAAAVVPSRMDGVPRLAISGDGGAPLEDRDPQIAADTMWSGIVAKLNKAAGFAK